MGAEVCVRNRNALSKNISMKGPHNYRSLGFARDDNHILFIRTGGAMSLWSTKAMKNAWVW